jgi:large subunit ribosomal protein L28
MSRVCDLTGKRAMVGNNVSHAMRTKRKFSVNLVKKRSSRRRWITLRVCIYDKTINKNGIAAVLKSAVRRIY